VEVSKEDVNKFINLSIKVSENYTGIWRTESIFDIILDCIPPGPKVALIDALTAEILPGGNLRNSPPTSAPTGVLSPPLTGGFGPSVVYIVSIVANDPNDDSSLYNAGDTIAINFNRPTMMANMPPGELAQEQVDYLFNFSMSLGSNYTGRWINSSTFLITITDPTASIRYWCQEKPDCLSLNCPNCATHTSEIPCLKQMPDSSIPDSILNLGSLSCPSCPSPQVVDFDLVNAGSAQCPNCSDPIFNWQERGICDYLNDGGYRPPTIHDLFALVYLSALLREDPPINLPSDGTDETGQVPLPRLSGNFGPASINITSVVGEDPDNSDGVFSNGDKITITFNEDTDYARLPLGELRKDMVDSLFTFSTDLGPDYVGIWVSRQVFEITITDASFVVGPALGEFFVTVKKAGDLRNFPRTCAPTETSGNVINPIERLTGNFGPSGIFILDFIASSPLSLSDRYAVGAAFTVYFNEKTNRGGLPRTGITKAQIDNLFGFSSDAHDPHPLGIDYVGAWIEDDSAIQITATVVDLNSVEGPPPLNNGIFRVSVKASGNLRNFPPQSNFTIIDNDNLALQAINGGISCDCCLACGSCEKCDIYSCGVDSDENGLAIDVCSDCCPAFRGQHCCRVLGGNYGKIVRLYDIIPRILDTVGQTMTIIGHGFDGREPRLNEVFVGGIGCFIIEVVVDEQTLDGTLTCRSPEGIGGDIKPVRVEVLEFFSKRLVIGDCCSPAPETDDGVLPENGNGGGISYRSPDVFSVMPTEVGYMAGALVSVSGRYFGPVSLFDANGLYKGPTGPGLTRADYTRPETFLIMKEGSAIKCLQTRHKGDRLVLCITPEMTSANASAVVVIADQRSRPWASGSIIFADQLPRFKYACPIEKSGRCFDCCEGECQEQFELQGPEQAPDVTLEFEGYHAFCAKECWAFCGFEEAANV